MKFIILNTKKIKWYIYKIVLYLKKCHTNIHFIYLKWNSFLKYIWPLPLNLCTKKEKILIHLCSFNCVISWKVWVPRRMRVSSGNIRRCVTIIIFHKKFWSVEDTTKWKNRNVTLLHIYAVIKFFSHMDWLKWTNLLVAKQVSFYLSARILCPLGISIKEEKNDL